MYGFGVLQNVQTAFDLVCHCKGFRGNAIQAVFFKWTLEFGQLQCCCHFLHPKVMSIQVFDLDVAHWSHSKKGDAAVLRGSQNVFICYQKKYQEKKYLARKSPGLPSHHQPNLCRSPSPPPLPPPPTPHRLAAAASSPTLLASPQPCELQRLPPSPTQPHAPPAWPPPPSPSASTRPPRATSPRRGAPASASSARCPRRRRRR